MMQDEQAIVARMGAFASGIQWPTAEGIDNEGDPERGWQGPYIAGTYLPVGIVGRNLADDWDGWLEHYQESNYNNSHRDTSRLSEAALRAARDYYLAHADLFQAQRWRDVEFDRRYRPGGDGERLRQDVADLLAALATAERERLALRAVLADLARDRWAGWGANADENRWVCFWCNADSGPDTDMNADDPPEHDPACPMAKAAALGATPPAAGGEA